MEAVAYRPVDGEMAEPEVCIIELGGTIGDIEGMPFVEAFRQFQFRVKVFFYQFVIRMALLLLYYFEISCLHDMNPRLKFHKNASIYF